MRILHRLGRAIHRAGRLVRDSCAGQCCGACSRVYAFNACCLAAPIQTVYVCSDATCQGTPIAEVFRIIVGSQCYARAEGSIPIGISSTMVLLDGADIDACDHGGCSSPECVDYCGNRFIPGTLCSGQDYSGPAVFVYAQGSQSCGVINVAGACFKFDPATTIPESALPLGAITLDPSTLFGPQNPNCCACVPGCNESTQTVTECGGGGTQQVERTCCCTNQRTVTGTISSVTTYNTALSSIITRTIQGTGRWEYDEFGTLTNQIGGIATVTEVNVSGPDTVYTVPFGPWAGCASQGIPSAFAGLAPFTWAEDCDVTANSGGGNTVFGVNNLSIVCRNANRNGDWQLRRNVTPGDPLSGQVLVAATHSSVWAVEYFGRCSGGCGGTAGRSAIAAARGASGGCAGCGDKGTGGATI